MLLLVALSWAALLGCAGPQWEYDSGRAFRRAQRDNRLVLIEYFSGVCRYSIQMDREVFTDPKVRGRLVDFVCLRQDFGLNQVRAKQLGITGTPGFVVCRPNGTVIGTPQIGFMDVAEFRAFLASSRLQR